MSRITLASIAVASLCVTACTSQEKVCAADQQLCSNHCTSLQSDPGNCGACGHACGAGQACSAGACVDCSTSPGVCTTEVLAACFNLDQVRPLGADLSPSSPPLATDTGPSSFARSGNDVYLANDLSSSISTLTLSPLSITSGAAAFAISSGNVGYSDLPHVAVHGGYLFASNAAANTLVVVDPVTGHTVDEVPLPPGGFGANPQGIDFVGNKGYLALNGIDAVAVLDVAHVPGVTLQGTPIDVSSLVAGTGVKAMPSQVVASADRVYVSLNGLDANFQPMPGEHGRLAVIDPASDTVVGSAVDLGASCLNPSGMALSGTTLWVACGFHPFNSAVVTGGSLVPVELATGIPVPGAAIVLADHAVASIALCGGHGYAGSTESGTVVSFDPVARSLSSSAVACPAPTGKAGYVSDLACAR